MIRQGHRNRPEEQERIGDIMRLLSDEHGTVLEIGARDGYITALLARKFEKVIALDLEKPPLAGDGIEAVGGDVRHLAYPSGHVDVVLCTEVLEHIEPAKRLAVNQLDALPLSHRGDHDGYCITTTHDSRACRNAVER